MKKSKLLYGIMGIYILIAACAVVVMIRQDRMKPVSGEPAAIQETQKSTQTEQTKETEAAVTETTAAFSVPAETEQRTVGALSGRPEGETAASFVYFVTGVSSVNLRSAPDKQSKTLAALPEGTSGKVLELGPYYSYVEYGGNTGYVYNVYLEIVEE